MECSMSVKKLRCPVVILCLLIMFSQQTAAIVDGSVMCPSAEATATCPTDLIACLLYIKGISNSVLSTPTSEAYNSDRLGFSLRFNYKPAAIFHPSSEDDTAAIIQCAAIHNVTITPRSGGHSYEGYSMGGKDGALVIDLNLFQKITVDASTRIATVGAGVRLGDLYTRLWDMGQYLIPGGTCPTVGIGGHALGGGIGMVGRKYGPLSDNIVSITMIDANSNVWEANATSNSDLFWALRGAGAGSFGLVTEFKIQAYQAPGKVTTLSIAYPLGTYRSAIEAFGSWGRSATDDIMAVMILSPSSIHINANFLGSKEQARTTIGPLLNQIPSKPTYIDMAEGTWLRAATKWGSGTLNSTAGKGGRYFQGRSLLYRTPLSTDEMDIIHKYLSHSPNNSTTTRVIIDIWGGRIDQPSSPSSAFDNHRGVLYGIQFFIAWSDPSGTPGSFCLECLEWTTNITKEMKAAYRSDYHLEAYQNYIEHDFPNWLQAYYGDNILRLQKIKKKFDPHNRFTFPQAIPLP
ncbi:hypothetical protein BGZ83_006378 [Gryganskiella cystojenkinii]|nr:hypothetical protein BGZ83_006378 [Gryganskiella cystojenkinii]